MTKQERLKLVEEIPFFKEISEDERDKLADNEDNFLFYKDGEYIINQGESETPIYILLKGKAIVTRNQNPNSELAKLKYGAVFGTVSMTESALRQTNVIAQNDVVVFRIKPEMAQAFEQETHKKFCQLRREVLIERLERLTLVVADLKAETELLRIESGEEDAEFNWDL